MSSADTARKVQGFLSATARPRCGNCRHAHEDIADRMPPYDTRTWRCRRGGFTVSAGAICDRWERDGVRAAAATPPEGQAGGR